MHSDKMLHLEVDLGVFMCIMYECWSKMDTTT